MIGRSLPYAGIPLGMAQAAVAAKSKQGQMVPIEYGPPGTSLRDWVGGAGNLLRFLGPLGSGAKMAGDIVGGLRGLMGAPEFFNTTWGGTAASLGGAGARGLMDKYGGISPALPATTSTIYGDTWKRSREGGEENIYSDSRENFANPNYFPNPNEAPRDYDQGARG